jgi:hypothetical protein
MAECPTVEGIEGDGAMAHVRFLADDALEGRGVASRGSYCAGDYIAAHFQELGLQPAGDDGTWFQSFPVRTGSEITGDNAFTFTDPDGADGGRTLGTETWVPFGFSGSGTIEAALVYGELPASQAGDDGGPAAMGGPPAAGAPSGGGEEGSSGGGPILVIEAGDGGRAPSQSAAGTYSVDPHYQGSVAQGRGASALVLLVEDTESLPLMETEDRPFLRIPVVAVAGGAAETLRSAARAGGTASITTAVGPRLSDARNVIALLPGTDPAVAEEVMILGAHYDHLGYGGEGSLAPGVYEIHNGADDNASGTAALLEVAEQLADSRPARSVLFMGFSGEERGLLGSAYFVRNPTVELEKAVAMINMDMVGRVRENTLTVFGLATAPEWEAALDAANRAQAEAFNLVLMPDGYGPSDHSSFYGAGMPVLHFFSNTHSEYHRPEDDWETINGPGLDRVAALVGTLTADAAGRGGEGIEGAPLKLTLVETQPPAPAEGGRSRGYGPYFGSVPDMGYQDFGVRLSGVRAGSPADAAGLQERDVIVSFGGTEVGDLYAYTYALREMSPGDVVEVVVIRDGQRLNRQAVLGERR